MKERILITSALPYANSALHLGHMAGAYLPGDVYARFERLCGNDVCYICGSDEHGVAITLSADLAGRTPKDHVDHFHKINKALFDKLGFQFDNYSRTTWPEHANVTVEFFKDLLANGYIEERTTEQLYSEQDKRFLADRYVVGTCPKCGFDNARGDECQKCGASYEAEELIRPRAKLSNSPLTLKATKHWFLRFDLLADKLKEWISHKDWKPNVTGPAYALINELKARAITRDSDWGIPVPLTGADGKVFYVWFDAPIGYISATVEWAQKMGNPEKWKDYWLDSKTKLVQFMGKDNIPFHAVFFPAMLLGQNKPYKTVDALPANEFFNLEGRKFSKSDGWTLDLDDLLSRYSVDQIRYMIASNAPETADSEFSWKDFQMRCNSELVGKLGNFANRTLVFAQNQCKGQIPAKGQLEPIDVQFIADLDRLSREIASSYEHYKLRGASQILMELCQVGNVYFDAKKPWQDAKDASLHSRLNTTIALCCEALKRIALAMAPIMPESAQKLWKMLGQKQIGELTWDAACSKELPAHTPLPAPSVLFARVEDEQIAAELEKLQAMSKAAAAANKQYVPLKEEIDIDTFSKIDLRTAKIIAAEALPKSKKLLKLTVDVGFEKRQIVSGISQYYKPEELVGKTVLVVANLKKATLMGQESAGMILAAKLDDQLEVLMAKSEAGAVIN